MVDGLDTLGESALAGGVLAMFAAYFVIMLVIWIVLYVYSALALMAIAKKTQTQNGWLAWIPIANIYLLTQMAGVSGLWTLVVLLDTFLTGGLATSALAIVMFWKIAPKIRFDSWTSLLLLVPIANLVIIGMWAWSKK